MSTGKTSVDQQDVTLLIAPGAKCLVFPKYAGMIESSYCTLMTPDNIVSIELLPKEIRENYEIHERKHACAILHNDFQYEWNDIVTLLQTFELKKSYITTPGGRKSQVSQFIDSFLYDRGWEEKHFDTRIVVDGRSTDAPTHDIDCYRNRIALEIEWNNKDPFYDRDLNNFRLLHDLNVISVGVIITRCSELQQIFNDLDRGKSYGTSTTHMGKLMPKVNGGGSGGCPLLIFGIQPSLYNSNA